MFCHNIFGILELIEEKVASEEKKKKNFVQTNYKIRIIYLCCGYEHSKIKSEIQEKKKIVVTEWTTQYSSEVGSVDFDFN